MPVDGTTLTLFLATIAVFILTPGPNMIFCLSRALLGGSAVGVYSAFGVCIGLTLHATAAGLGLSQLFHYFPLAYDVLRVAGAGYLLWLAWQAYRAAPGAAIVACEATPCGEKRRVPIALTIAQGALNALLSPKAVFFYLVLFPQFLDPTRGSILIQSLFLITIINVMNFTFIASLCLCAGRSSRWLIRHPRALAWQQKLVALVFVGLAARVLISRAPASS